LIPYLLQEKGDKDKTNHQDVNGIISDDATDWVFAGYDKADWLFLWQYAINVN
jgi:hypothetical protein